METTKFIEWITNLLDENKIDMVSENQLSLIEKIIKSQERLEVLQKISKTIPNDHDLGSYIRSVFLNNKE